MIKLHRALVLYMFLFLQILVSRAEGKIIREDISDVILSKQRSSKHSQTHYSFLISLLVCSSLSLNKSKQIVWSLVCQIIWIQIWEYLLFNLNEFVLIVSWLWMSRHDISVLPGRILNIIKLWQRNPILELWLSLSSSLVNIQSIISRWLWTHCKNLNMHCGRIMCHLLSIYKMIHKYNF